MHIGIAPPSDTTSASGLKWLMRKQAASSAISQVLLLVPSGNSLLSNLPLYLRMIDPQAQVVLAEFPFSPNLAIGATFSQSAYWNVSAGPTPLPSQYVVQLQARLGSTSLTLAQDIVKVLPAAVQTALDVSQQTATWQNVLVFSRCKRLADDLLGQCGAAAVPLEDAVKLAQCDTDRAAALDTWLTSAGVAHRITSNGSEFLQLLRSGGYNTVWISNGATSLRELPVAEIRAASVRGGGLLIEGLSNGRNPQLLACGGVGYLAKYPLADQPLSLLGNLFTPGDYRITALPVQLKAAGGVAEAKLGPVASTTDGIISARLGDGKSLTFGFDWSETLRSQTTAADKARWLDVTQKSLSWLKPQLADGSHFGGEVITLATRLQNSGQPLVAQVLQNLPPGVQVLATEPQALPSTANSALWSLNLPSGADLTLKLRLRLPLVDGNADIATQVSLQNNGIFTPFKSLASGFAVRSSSSLLTQLMADLTALQLSTSAQLEARSAILAELVRTQAALAKNQPDQALRRLLLAQARLSRIDGSSAQARAMARLIAAVAAGSR